LEGTELRLRAFLFVVLHFYGENLVFHEMAYLKDLADVIVERFLDYESQAAFC